MPFLSCSSSAPKHLSVRVSTHDLGVHKAASGACCSDLKRSGTAPPLGHCRCPRTRWCCTSGTDMSPPCRSDLLWLDWECGRTGGTSTFFSPSSKLEVTISEFFDLVYTTSKLFLTKYFSLCLYFFCPATRSSKNNKIYLQTVTCSERHTSPVIMTS